MYEYHLYAQFGCFALAESIHVSSQPVAPSFGMISLTGTFAATSDPVVTGHDAPIDMSPFLKRLTSSDDRPQYFLTSGFCFLIRSIAALNWVWFSSYGSLMPRLGFVFDRYSATSAIWIGLFGTVTRPLYFEL